MNIHGMNITVISPVLVYEDGAHSLYWYCVVARWMVICGLGPRKVVFC